MNWAGISVAFGVITVAVLTAPLGLVALAVLLLAFSGKIWKP